MTINPINFCSEAINPITFHLGVISPIRFQNNSKSKNVNNLIFRFHEYTNEYPVGKEFSLRQAYGDDFLKLSNSERREMGCIVKLMDDQKKLGSVELSRRDAYNHYVKSR